MLLRAKNVTLPLSSAYFSAPDANDAFAYFFYRKLWGLTRTIRVGVT